MGCWGDSYEILARVWWDSDKILMGFWCDSVSMNYVVSDFKVQHIKSLIVSVTTNSTCKLRLLSQVCGKLMSIQKAMGPVIPILLRSSFMCLAENIHQGDPGSYDNQVTLDTRVSEDLNYLGQHLEEFNGFPIFGNKVGYCLNQALEEGDIKAAERELGENEELWVSDSSDIRAVSYNAFDVGNEISIQSFSVSQVPLSSQQERNIKQNI